MAIHEPAKSPHSYNPAQRLVLLVFLLAIGYFCIRTLRFTSNGLNVAFVGVFLLLPFLAIKPVLRLRRGPKIATSIVLGPLLMLSLIALLFMTTCDIPAAIEHRELSRELSSIEQEHYSVHLLWTESAGGAVGPHGVALEQRMFIFPGLYVVKHLAYFEGAFLGGLSLEEKDKVRLHIPKTNSHAEVNQVYSLKRWVYF